MIIDFHTHIVPPEIIENREQYFPSEPAFKLLYESPAAKLATVEDLIRMMDEEAVEKAVTFGFPWTNPDLFRWNNDYVSEAVAKFPNRLKGFGCFDLYNEYVAIEAERCLKNGLCGFGELAFYQSGIDQKALDLLEPVMRISEAHNLPVLIHTNEPVGHPYPGKTPITLNQVYQLALRYPKNKIVLAHWGGGIFFYLFMKKQVKNTLKNIYYDIAASPFLYDSAIYKFAWDLVGPDKILLASDYPLLKPSRYQKDFSAAGLTENQIAAIQGLNAAKLLNI
ncbi:amidohydrolase family protein [Desulfobacula sp.]|uniref:amidohydrolase family protein n=1 Tax=Desulfobacula sp. TaxID=2593537 RepID=UPI001EBAB8E3|nr:amidohydrolase family protein [Desulfobacula sp.]